MSPKISVESTVTMPPQPMERSASASKTVRLDRPMATAMPETATALPTLPIIRSTAISTS